jgi:hypothetical protein
MYKNYHLLYNFTSSASDPPVNPTNVAICNPLGTTIDKKDGQGRDPPHDACCCLCHRQLTEEDVASDDGTEVKKFIKIKKKS